MQGVSSYDPEVYANVSTETQTKEPRFLAPEAQATRNLTSAINMLTTTWPSLANTASNIPTFRYMNMGILARVIVKRVEEGTEDGLLKHDYVRDIARDYYKGQDTNVLDRVIFTVARYDSAVRTYLHED